MAEVQFGLVITCCILTIYNLFMLLSHRQRVTELKAFEDTLKELLLRIRARALKRK